MKLDIHKSVYDFIYGNFVANSENRCCVTSSVILYEIFQKLNLNPRLVYGYWEVDAKEHGVASLVENFFLEHVWVECDNKIYDVGNRVAQYTYKKYGVPSVELKRVAFDDKPEQGLILHSKHKTNAEMYELLTDTKQFYANDEQPIKEEYDLYLQNPKKWWARIDIKVFQWRNKMTKVALKSIEKGLQWI
jgi:hypothetical protein